MTDSRSTKTRVPLSDQQLSVLLLRYENPHLLSALMELQERRAADEPSDGDCNLGGQCMFANKVRS